ncbi:unnamed protein product [Lactuca virosa]|uniref:Uncharacterized protein n=1 Tax=Lactuca virosa TaxID=75947 RepID=A0AAU9LUJ5_9ASTR|nr:unnamed protein product [Lactuca virosa]
MFKVNEGSSKESQVFKKKAPSQPKFTIDISVSKDVARHKKKSNLKSGIVNKEVTEEEAQQNKKHKATRLLKRFKKLRAQTVEEISTTAKVVDGDKDSEEMEEMIHKTDDLTFHVSPRKDATVESHGEEISNQDVTVHTYNVDTNINTGATISTSIAELKIVTPPEVPSSKSKMEEDRSSNISESLYDND